MLEKLKSRKLLVTVAVAIANVVLPILGVPAGTLEAITHLASWYLGAQGITDAAEAFKGK